MSVPFPSAASIEPLENETVVDPTALGVNVTDKIGERAANPDGVPPLKVIVPLEFENVGSAVHSENAELSLEIELTESMVGSNVTVPSEALTVCPLGSTEICTVNGCPTVSVADAGESVRSAAYVVIGIATSATPTTSDRRKDRMKKM